MSNNQVETNNIEQTNTAQVSSVSDEQIEKYFESGGREPLEAVPSSHEEPIVEAPIEKLEANSLETVKVEAPEKKVEQSEGEEARNYRIAMQEEREKRRELQDELRETRLRQQRMEEAFQKFIERANNPEPKAPDFDENPLENLRYEQERLKQAQMRMHETELQRAQREQAYVKQQEFISKYQSDAASFTEKNPDDYLVKSRLEEHKAAGYTNEQANRLVIEDEMAIASRAYQEGVNPAERVYKIAKLRGFNHQPKPQSQPHATSDKEKFEAVTKGIQASKSLSNGGGGKVDKPLTLESLTELSDDEFDRVDWKRFWKGR
jgi:hypothetical protein